ncbi:MAG: hypothetical protein ACETWM_18965 [Candidatus Lokiarchaeia archaeon]
MTPDEGDDNVENSYINNIVDEFIKKIEDFKNRGIIGDGDLRKHTESNIHSWLQYLMIRSGEQSGLLAIPEIKLKFTKPINPIDYGLKNRRKRRHFSRVDIAFYDSGKSLLGCAEIFTMDGAHGSLPSARLAEVGHYWLTPRDSLLHMIQHGLLRPKFIILVVILMKRSPYKIWRTGIKEIDSEIERDKNYYQVYKPYWKEFKNKIGIDNALLIITEDGIEKC